MSLGKVLGTLCDNSGVGLAMHEVDILVSGDQHDPMDKPMKDTRMARVQEGEFDCCSYSPLCGSSSGANWANDTSPQPCRNRAHPTFCTIGISSAAVRWTAMLLCILGIRGIEAAQRARGASRIVSSFLEQPKDLGRTHRGQPASIWQLPEIPKAFGNTRFWTVAGHRCQYPGTDRAKPTRLLSDLPGSELFGHAGWPTFDAAVYNLGLCPEVVVIGMPNKLLAN